MSNGAKRSDQRDDQKQESGRQRKPLDQMAEPGQQGEPPQWVRVLNALLLGFVIFYAIQFVSQSASEELTYNQFKQEVSAGNVPEVTIKGHQVNGVMKSSGDSGDTSGRQPFRTYIPEVGDTKIVDLLESNNVTITAKESGPSLFSRLLVGFLPWLIIIGLLIFFWQRMQRQMGGTAGWRPVQCGQIESQTVFHGRARQNL